MSSVIRFLDEMGRNPVAGGMIPGDYIAAVEALDVSDVQRQALLDRNQAVLNKLLEGRARVLCAVFPAEEDPQPEEEQPNEDPEREEPSESTR